MLSMQQLVVKGYRLNMLADGLTESILSVYIVVDVRSLVAIPFESHLPQISCMFVLKPICCVFCCAWGLIL